MYPVDNWTGKVDTRGKKRRPRLPTIDLHPIERRVHHGTQSVQEEAKSQGSRVRDGCLRCQVRARFSSQAVPRGAGSPETLIPLISPQSPVAPHKKRTQRPVRTGETSVRGRNGAMSKTASRSIRGNLRRGHRTVFACSRQHARHADTTENKPPPSPPATTKRGAKRSACVAQRETRRTQQTQRTLHT
jgi:hypothetical protein